MEAESSKTQATPPSASGKHEFTREEMANEESLLLILPGANVYFGPGAAVHDVQILPAPSTGTSKPSPTLAWTRAAKHEDGVASNHRGKNVVNSGGEPGETAICVVCWCEPTAGMYTTPCGHLYCTSCFANQCSSANADTIPIRCLGAEGDCQRIFYLSELRTALGLQAFEDLLEAALAAHIKVKPEKFRYCPTADCPNVYRVSEDGEIVTCFSCNTLLCSTCHTVSHEGKTCQENQALPQGNQAFRDWKDQNKAKDCPRCTNTIQKTEGCNHMLCLVCRAHLCWFCLEVFETEPEIYAHMEAVHGSYVDPEDDAMIQVAQQPRPVDPRLMEQLRQDHGGLIQIEDAEQDNLFANVNQPGAMPDLGDEDRLRIVFASRVVELEEDGFMRMPPRRRERVVREHGPQSAPLQPSTLLAMLRRRRDNQIFRNLQQLEPLDANVLLENLDLAVAMLIDGAEVAIEEAVEALPGLRNATPEFVYPLVKAIQKDPDWARLRGGQRLELIFGRRVQRMNRGRPLAPLPLDDLLGAIFFDREICLVREVQYIATAAPLGLENMLQALEEAFTIAARDETAEGMDASVGAPLAPADTHRINPAENGGKRLIRQIARRITQRSRDRRRRLVFLHPHEQLQIFLHIRQDFITKASHEGLLRDIRRRIQQPELIAPLQPIELLVLLRRGQRELIQEHITRLMMEPDLFRTIRLKRNVAEALQMRRTENRDRTVHREADARIDELVARLACVSTGGGST
ncbi:hypothetical protein MMC30_007527 [Trapelia coarctata]|nr:hypothetical protein [Trapelia coarctata]